MSNQGQRISDSTVDVRGCGYERVVTEKAPAAEAANAGREAGVAHREAERGDIEAGQ